MWEGLLQVATPYLCLLFPLETVPGSFLTNQGIYSLTGIHRACQSHQHTRNHLNGRETFQKAALLHSFPLSLSATLRY